MRSLSIFLLIIISHLAHAQSWEQCASETIKLQSYGLYEQAELQAQKCLNLALKTYGSKSWEYGQSLSNLAYAQKSLGEYDLSIHNFRKTEALAYKLFGNAHYEHIAALNNLANTYMDIEKYDSAEFFVDQIAQSLKGTELDRNDPVSVKAYVNYKNTVASLYHKKGGIEKAIQTLEEIQSADLSLEALGSDYFVVLNNLSSYYLEAGLLKKAGQTLTQSVTLLNEYGKTLDLLYAMQNLGGYYRKTELYDSASLVWNRALHIIAEDSIQDAQLTNALLTNLGEMFTELGDDEQAINYLTRAKSIQDSRAAINPGLYEVTLSNLAIAYMDAGNYQAADTLYHQLMHQLVEDVVYNFNYLSVKEKQNLYRKQRSYFDDFGGFALAVCGFPQLQESENPYINKHITTALYNQQLMTKGIILNSSDKMRQQILASSDERLKKNYYRWVKSKNHLANMALQMDASKVAELKLKIDSLEKVLIKSSRQFEKGFTVTEKTWKEVQQHLKPGEAAVEMVRLIDGLVYAALIVTPEVSQPVMSLIWSKNNRLLEKEMFYRYRNLNYFQRADTSSYKIYWRPIIDSIRSNSFVPVKKVYFSPDGIYNQISLQGLYNPAQNDFVLDEIELTYITNTGNLLENPEQPRAPKNALLMGNPRFTLGASKIIYDYEPLPGTSEEILKIDSILEQNDWKTVVLNQKSATEEALKEAKSYSVVHLATHGFFNQESTGNDLTDAMLQSGIALAGANTLQGGEGQDGILTAYEASLLNLDNTRLVVLSACETGLGVYHPGEGVYGLQKALESAGASHVLMSLWKVNDEATWKLMTLFYTYWVQSGDIQESFKRAQRQLRQAYPAPYYWSAFVLSGT
ncbi:MAG: CHAT domain-containing protein [Cyclobacteriaceae bacterium]|nr:CHAT domain-containing protein [Cyclobacteriaceae bacterium]